MTKIRTILKSAKRSDGKQQVLLLLSDRGERSYFTTGFFAAPNEFDEGKDAGRFIQGRGVRSFNIERKEEDGSTKSYTNKEANDKLAELESRAADIIAGYNREHINWSMDQFRSDYVNAPKRKYFLDFAEDIVEKEYRQRGQYSTADTVKYTLISMKRFDSSLPTRMFQDITPRYLSDYEAFSRKEGAEPGTMSIRARVIKRIFNIAIRERVITNDLYPFSRGAEDGKYHVPQTKLTKTNQFLPMDSLKKLAKTSFKSKQKERDKHLFLFSFYCNGINWKDMAQLTTRNIQLTTSEDGDEITVLRYQRSKTQGLFEIQVTDVIQAELDWFKNNTRLFRDYLLPIITSKVEPEKHDAYVAQKRKRFNAMLKKMALELNLPESQLNLTSYHARHSFAMALQRKGTSVDYISQSLGHQSVKTTKHYLARFSTTKMAEETYINLLAETPEETFKASDSPKKSTSTRPREPKIKDVSVNKEKS